MFCNLFVVDIYIQGAFYQDLYDMHPARTNQYRLGSLCVTIIDLHGTSFAIIIYYCSAGEHTRRLYRSMIDTMRESDYNSIPSLYLNEQFSRKFYDELPGLSIDIYIYNHVCAKCN